MSFRDFHFNCYIDVNPMLRGYIYIKKKKRYTSSWKTNIFNPIKDDIDGVVTMYRDHAKLDRRHFNV